MHDASEPRRQDQYRILFERSADAILIIDGDRFIDCNQATVDMLRCKDRAELLQTHPSELSPEFQPDGRRSFEKANEMIAIAFEHGSHRFEWDHRRADGEVFPVEVLLTTVPQDDKVLLHVVWRDITERKSLEEELRHAQKMEAIGRLAGGVAHDFNNLLVAIIGYAGMLENELEGDERQAGFAARISEAARRAADLTSQLLSFGRKQVLEPVALDLDVKLEDLACMLRRLIGEHVSLRIEHTADCATVRADASRIEQMLMNLVANARDAMPDGGVVTIRTATVDVSDPADRGLAPGRYVSLCVSDTGIGMSPDVAARAFEPFFTMKERGQGTGLGLASVYGTVKQSGGDVQLSSAKGRGTTIEILLPITEERPLPPAPADRGVTASTCHSGQTILVVEDEGIVAGFVRQALSERGFHVLEAPNGAIALRKVSSSPEPIDLVLTDVVMPVMSGPEMARHLLRDRADLPVLFMSGYTDDTLTDHGFDAESVNLLRKPFSPSELLAAIERCLDAIESGS
ncbi:MAG: response regulator [Planctomycetes bacterium]|nr:response regulator [Planctomycetota bacterium]